MTFVSTPNSGQSLGETRDQMRTNTDLLRSAIAVNHVDLNLADVGKHKFVVMPVQSAAPTTVSGEAATYSKNVGGESQVFFVRDNIGSTEIQLTGNALIQSQNGYTFLPGGLMLQWGAVPASSSSTYNVTFTPAFNTSVYTIQYTATRAASSPGSNNDTWIVDSSISVSGFQISNPGGHNFGFLWYAIGKA